MKDIVKLGVTLALMCAIAAGGLALTYAATRDEIVKQLEEQKRRARLAAFPNLEDPVFKDREELADEAKKKFDLVTDIFDAYQDGTKAGRGFQMSPRGYGGFISMVVGMDVEGEVVGVTVVSHNETPGLGSAIVELKFLGQFRGKDPSDPVEVNKDIDAISGATKSSKAVTKGVKQALEAFEATEGK